MIDRPAHRRESRAPARRATLVVSLLATGALFATIARAVPAGVAPLSTTPAQQSIGELRAARGPFDPAVPAPESVLGFYPGADFKLANWPSILEYLRRLDDASERMQLVEIGESAEGQTMVLAVISHPDNLANLERYRAISERLARGDASEAEARALAAEGKSVVWVDSGLHATEVAHGQHAPEFAYVMVAGESAELERMRRDVVLLLMPNLNPDGLNIVADWYESNLGTEFETSRLPVLYQKYVGHDNNRDWYMITQSETRAVARQLYEVWYPQIVYNHHQSAPFPARIFVPPFADPANPNIPPLVLRGIARVGNAITTRLEAEDKPGAVSRMGFTAWWNGGMRTAPYFHNMIGILTETALFRYATPNFYPPDQLPESFSNGVPTREPSMNYPMPWPGGWWRLRDPIEYMLTASLATVDVGSRYREDWLLNMWRMARASIAQGERGGPAGWVIPPEQHDEGAAVALVNVLMRGGLSVERADEAFTADGIEYPAGSYVVPAAQAFRSYAVDLLEPQLYPDRRLYPGGPPDPPYDMAGWTLPFQMGVQVDRIEAPFSVSAEPLAQPAVAVGRLEGSGSTYLIDPRNNDAAKAVNELLAAGLEVFRAAAPTQVGGAALPAGAFVVRGEPGAEGRIAEVAQSTGVVVRATERRPRGDGWALRAPRIALYEPWVASMDGGWTRFVLEQYGFEYRAVRDAEIRKGNLRNAYDVVILPSASASSLIEGNAAGSMPAEYTGGLGDTGVAALRRFAAEGGTLVALDDSGSLPIDRFGLPLSEPLEGLSREEFFCPGSLLRIDVDNTHPVAHGLPAEATAFFVRSSAFAPLASDDGSVAENVRIVASYANGDLLESGWILGEEHLRGHAAVVEVAVGSGRVVLIGFRAQFRAQPHETFKLLFNSLFYGSSDPTTLP